MKKSLLFLSSLLLFFCLLIFPARTFFYACEGVNLWFHTILPSLLPFLILTSLLLETGAARRISARAEVFFQTVFGLSPAGFYALFLGLFCGFPMGARITAQLYEAEEIDRNEACYLLTFCSSPSPAFLSSYVILTAFSGQIHPGFVFGVLYGSNFLTGFCSGLFSAASACTGTPPIGHIPWKKKRCQNRLPKETCWTPLS